jgi:hypothetical protein
LCSLLRIYLLGLKFMIQKQFDNHQLFQISICEKIVITFGRVTIWFIWEFLLNRTEIIYFIILKFYWFINVLLALALQVSLVSESLSCSWLWCLVWQSFSDWDGTEMDLLQTCVLVQYHTSIYHVGVHAELSCCAK